MDCFFIVVCLFLLGVFVVNYVCFFLSFNSIKILVFGYELLELFILEVMFILLEVEEFFDCLVFEVWDDLVGLGEFSCVVWYVNFVGFVIYVVLDLVG